MSCSRVSPSYSLDFCLPLAIRASLGSVFVVAIPIRFPTGLDSHPASADPSAEGCACWIVYVHARLEKRRKFGVGNQKRRSDHVTGFIGAPSEHIHCRL